MQQGPFVSPYAYEWFIEGEVAAAKGEHDEAAMALETASAAPADDELLLTRLAEEYERSGAARRADRTLATARRAYPDSPRVWLTQGRLAQHRGEHEAAILAFLRAKQLAPSWEEPVLELADTLRAQGHDLRAQALLVEHVATSSRANTHRTRRALIDLAETRGDPEALRRALSLASGADTEREAYLAAELAFQNGQPALARRLLEDHVGVPEHRALWLRASVQSGALESVRTFLTRADSEELGGPLRHASLLLEVQERDLALERLLAAPPSAEAQHLKGRALAELGHHVSACRALAKVPWGSGPFEASRLAFADSARAQMRAGAGAEALSLAPNDSLAVRQALAALHLDAGNLRAALRLFDVRRSEDRGAIAGLFEQGGQYREAAAYYATIEPGAPVSADVQVRAAAERLDSRGLDEGAIAVLSHRAETAPTDLYARVRLVELLLRVGHIEDARKQSVAMLPLVHDSRLAEHVESLLNATHGR